MLGISKEPTAVVRQSDTIYSWLPFGVKVRSRTVAACKVDTSDVSMSRFLRFISANVQKLVLQSTKKK